MLYKNISDTPVWILCNSMKTLVCPGEVINLSIPDINHSGSTMRFFESLAKHQVVKTNGWDMAEKLKKDPIAQKINDENMPELTIEKNLLSDKASINEGK
jgi:hypothetical protein